MPSKGEQARRRAARGLGHNGVPQQPTVKPSKGVKKEKTPAPAALESTPATTTTAEIAATSCSQPATATTTQPARVSPRRSTIPDVHRDSVVHIFMDEVVPFTDGTISTVSTRLGGVPAAKLLSASKRFEEWFKQQPQNTVKQDFRFDINATGVTREAIEGFMDWLLTVHCPFSTNFFGTKLVPAFKNWHTGAIADLLVFCRWLELKAPFSTRYIEDHLWGYFKDKEAIVFPRVICSVWASRSSLEAKLRLHTIYRAVEYVNEVDKTNGDDTTHQAFLAAFASNDALLDAYKTKIQRNRDSEAAKEKRKQEYKRRAEEAKENRKYRELKKKENEKKRQEEATISLWEYVRK